MFSLLCGTHLPSMPAVDFFYHASEPVRRLRFSAELPIDLMISAPTVYLQRFFYRHIFARFVAIDIAAMPPLICCF